MIGFFIIAVASGSLGRLRRDLGNSIRRYSDSIHWIVEDKSFWQQIESDEAGAADNECSTYYEQNDAVRHAVFESKKMFAHISDMMGSLKEKSAKDVVILDASNGEATALETEFTDYLGFLKEPSNSGKQLGKGVSIIHPRLTSDMLQRMKDFEGTIGASLQERLQSLGVVSASITIDLSEDKLHSLQCPAHPQGGQIVGTGDLFSLLGKSFDDAHSQTLLYTSLATTNAQVTLKKEAIQARMGIIKKMEEMENSVNGLLLNIGGDHLQFVKDQLETAEDALKTSEVAAAVADASAVAETPGAAGSQQVEEDSAVTEVRDQLRATIKLIEGAMNAYNGVDVDDTTGSDAKPDFIALVKELAGSYKEQRGITMDLLSLIPEVDDPAS